VRYIFAIVIGFLLVFGLCLGSNQALACSAENYPSVHFNTQQPDFGAPPRPFSVQVWGEDADRPIGDASRKTRDWNQENYLRTRWEKRGIEALGNARRLERTGKLEDSIEHYRNALRHGIGNAADVRDRVEICAEISRKTDRKLLNEYISARRDYEFHRYKKSEKRMKLLAANSKAGFLRTHALYTLGAIQYDRNKFTEAAGVFENVAKLYPKSPRREASLIMVARSLVRSPAQKDEYVWVDSPKVKADAVARARVALNTLLKDYPRTRFYQDALGWRARCDYVSGQRVAALKSYLRQFASSDNTSYRIGAGASINFVSRNMNVPDSKQFARALQRDPSLLAAYLEYRIYHSNPEKGDLQKLADMATRAARHNRLHLPAKISARLAEIQYLRGRYHNAVSWANKALATGSRDGRDLAIYVRGSSKRKMGLSKSAESDFSRLLSQYPKSYLCGAARENLALIYENSKRPGLALDLYFKLDYEEDIAYILDARMTTRQVASYIRTHQSHPKLKMLVYTLGIRQLRDGRYSQAAKTLASLSDKNVRSMMVTEQAYWWDSIHTRPRDPRKSARDLAHLERAVVKAKGKDAKAAAMFAQASYIYDNRDLLFYNAALWQGNRGLCFTRFWDTQAATLRDETAVRKHHHIHECLYVAREMCLKIAKRYPKSPTAPKALYRAACASQYVAELNGWWRNEADRTGLWNQSYRLMKRLYTNYPKDPLAKSARKYSKVFAKVAAQENRSGMFKVAKK
jgi:TolA-binding protein